MTRQEFMYEIKKLMFDHNLSLQQVMILYAMLYKIEWDYKSEDYVALLAKGLLKPGNKVNVDKLFPKDKEEPELDLTFETSPITTEETAKLVKTLEGTFVPEKNKNPNVVKEIAETHFAGDINIARHFIIFKALFPKATESTDNAKWNMHFGFRYTGTTRWKTTPILTRQFAKIYKSKDIGLFLSGTYYYIRDSIDTARGTCYASTADKYIRFYTDWYDIAKEKLEEGLKRANEPQKSL